MRKTFLAVMAVFAVAGSAQAANLVKNGDFSQNTLSPAEVMTLPGLTRHGVAVGVEADTHLLGRDNIVTDWSSPSSANRLDYNLYFFDGATAKTGDAASIYGSEEQRPDSKFVAMQGQGAFMVLDGDPTYTGDFQQTINGLNNGAIYTLSFDWAAGELSNRTGYSTVTLTGSLGGDAFTTSTFTNLAAAGVAGDFSGWSRSTFTFTAHAGSELLSFLAVGTAPGPNLPPVAFLDNVSLTAVPEPAAWTLMVLGFGGLGASMRRRRAKAAHA